MADQASRWLISVDLDTTGIQRGLQGVNGMLNALGAGAGGSGADYGPAALPPASLAQLGPPSTVATNTISSSQGEMRNLMAAQGQVAALMQAQLAASSRLIGRQIQDLNRFGELYFDRLKNQIRGFNFFPAQQQAEIQRAFSDAFNNKSSQLFASLNNINLEDISTVFNRRLEREAALISANSVLSPSLTQGSSGAGISAAAASSNQRYSRELDRIMQTNASIARQFTGLLEQTNSLQSQVIRSQKEIVAANRFAAQATRDRVARSYNQVLAVAVGRPELAQAAAPLSQSTAPRALPSASPAQASTGVIIPPAINPAATFERRINERAAAQTVLVVPAATPSNLTPARNGFSSYGDSSTSLSAAEQALVKSLNTKAQALDRQTAVLTSNYTRFTQAEAALISALERKAAEVNGLPASGFPGAVTTGAGSGAFGRTPVGAAFALPRGRASAFSTPGLNDYAKLVSNFDLDGVPAQLQLNAGLPGVNYRNQSGNSLIKFATPSLPTGGVVPFNKGRTQRGLQLTPELMDEYLNITGQARQIDTSFSGYRNDFSDLFNQRGYNNDHTRFAQRLFAANGRSGASLVRGQSVPVYDGVPDLAALLGDEQGLASYTTFPQVASSYGSWDGYNRGTGGRGRPQRSFGGLIALNAPEQFVASWDTVGAQTPAFSGLYDPEATKLLTGSEVLAPGLGNSLPANVQAQIAQFTATTAAWRKAASAYRGKGVLGYSQFMGELPAGSGDVFSTPERPNNWKQIAEQQYQAEQARYRALRDRGTAGVLATGKALPPPPEGYYYPADGTPRPQLFRSRPAQDLVDRLGAGDIGTVGGVLRGISVPFVSDQSPFATNDGVRIAWGQTPEFGGEVKRVNGQLVSGKERPAVVVAPSVQSPTGQLGALVAGIFSNLKSDRRYEKFFNTDLSSPRTAFNDAYDRDGKQRYFNAGELSFLPYSAITGMKGQNGGIPSVDPLAQYLNRSLPRIASGTYNSISKIPQFNSRFSLVRQGALATALNNGPGPLTPEQVYGELMPGRGPNFSTASGPAKYLGNVSLAAEKALTNAARVWQMSPSPVRIAMAEASGDERYVAPQDREITPSRSNMESSFHTAGVYPEKIGDAARAMIEALNNAENLPKRMFRGQPKDTLPQGAPLGWSEDVTKSLSFAHAYHNNGSIGISSGSPGASIFEASKKRNRGVSIAEILGAGYDYPSEKEWILPNPQFRQNLLIDPAGRQRVEDKIAIQKSKLQEANRNRAAASPSLPSPLPYMSEQALKVFDFLNKLDDKAIQNVDGDLVAGITNKAGLPYMGTASLNRAVLGLTGQGLAPGLATLKAIPGGQGSIDLVNALEDMSFSQTNYLEDIRNGTLGEYSPVNLGQTRNELFAVTGLNDIEAVKQQGVTGGAGKIFSQKMNALQEKYWADSDAELAALSTPKVIPPPLPFGFGNIPTQRWSAPLELPSGVDPYNIWGDSYSTAGNRGNQPLPTSAPAERLAAAVRAIEQMAPEAFNKVTGGAGGVSLVPGLSGGGIPRLGVLRGNGTIGISDATLGRTAAELGVEGGTAPAAPATVIHELLGHAAFGNYGKSSGSTGQFSGFERLINRPVAQGGLGGAVDAEGNVAVLPPLLRGSSVGTTQLVGGQLAASELLAEMTTAVATGTATPGVAEAYRITQRDSGGLGLSPELLQQAGQAAINAFDGVATAAAAATGAVVADTAATVTHTGAVAADTVASAIPQNLGGLPFKDLRTVAEQQGLVVGGQPVSATGVPKKGQTRAAITAELEAVRATQIPVTPPPTAAEVRQSLRNSGFATPIGEGSRSATYIPPSGPKNFETFGREAFNPVSVPGLEAQLSRSAARRDLDASLGTPGLRKGAQATRRQTRDAQVAYRDAIGGNFTAVDALLGTGAGRNSRRAIDEGFVPLQAGKPGSELWAQASSGVPGELDAARLMRDEIRARNIAANPAGFAGQAANVANLTDFQRELASGAIPAGDPRLGGLRPKVLEGRLNNLLSETIATQGFTPEDLQRGGFIQYREASKAQQSQPNPPPPPPPPPGYKDWEAAGAPLPGQGAGGGTPPPPLGGNPSAASGPVGPGRRPSLFQRVRQGIRADSGLGGFFGQGALSTIKYGLPAMALYGAAGALSSSLKDAEELRYNFARLESQMQDTFGSGTENRIKGVKQAIMDLANESGVSASVLTEMEIKIRGAFEGQVIEGQSGEALVKKQRDAAAKIAVVTKLPAKEVNDGLTAASLAFGSSFETLGNIATRLESRSGVPSGELISFLGDVAPVAADAGFTAEEIAAFGTVTLQRSGKSGASLAEQINRVLPAVTQNIPQIQELVAGTPALQTPELIDALRNVDGAGIVRELSKNFEGLNKEAQDFVINLLGGRRESQAIISGFNNADKVSKYFEAASDSAGALDDRFQKIRGTLTNTVQRLSQQFTELAKVLLDSGLAAGFAGILGIISGMVSTLTPLIGLANSFNEALNGWPAGILAAAAAFKLVQLGMNRFGGLASGYSRAKASLPVGVSGPVLPSAGAYQGSFSQQMARRREAFTGGVTGTVSRGKTFFQKSWQNTLDNNSFNATLSPLQGWRDGRASAVPIQGNTFSRFAAGYRDARIAGVNPLATGLRAAAGRASEFAATNILAPGSALLGTGRNVAAGTFESFRNIRQMARTTPFFADVLRTRASNFIGDTTLRGAVSSIPLALGAAKVNIGRGFSSGLGTLREAASIPFGGAGIQGLRNFKNRFDIAKSGLTVAPADFGPGAGMVPPTIIPPQGNIAAFRTALRPSLTEGSRFAAFRAGWRNSGEGMGGLWGRYSTLRNGSPGIRPTFDAAGNAELGVMGQTGNYPGGSPPVAGLTRRAAFGGALAQSSPILSGLGGAAAASGRLVASSFASVGAAFVANPMIGIMAAAGVYGFISNKIAEDQKNLEKIIEDTKEGTTRAKNLVATGKDPTAIVTNYANLGNRAIEFNRTQSNWDRGWRTITNSRSEADALLAAREMSLTSPEYDKYAPLLAADDLTSAAAARLVFGTGQDTQKSENVRQQFRKLTDPVKTGNWWDRNGLSALKGFGDALNPFDSGATDLTRFTSINLDEIQKQVGAGQISGDTFNYAKRVYEAAGITDNTTALNSDVLRAAGRDNPVQALQELQTSAPNDPVIAQQTRDLIDSLTTGALSKEDLKAGLEGAVDADLGPKEKMVKKIQELNALKDSGAISLNEYINSAKQRITDARNALFGGSGTAPDNDEIAAYFNEQKLFNQKVAQEKQAIASRRVEDLQAFGFGEGAVAKETITQNVALLDDPTIKDPEARRTAALALLEATQIYYSNLLGQAKDLEDSYRILAEMQNSEGFTKAIETLNLTEIQSSGSYQKEALYYQNTRSSSKYNTALQGSVGPDELLSFTQRDLQANGGAGYSTDVQAILDAQVKSITDEYAALAASNGGTVPEGDLTNLGGALAFVLERLAEGGVDTSGYSIPDSLRGAATGAATGATKEIPKQAKVGDTVTKQVDGKTIEYRYNGTKWEAYQKTDAGAGKFVYDKKDSMDLTDQQAYDQGVWTATETVPDNAPQTTKGPRFIGTGQNGKAKGVYYTLDEGGNVVVDPNQAPTPFEPTTAAEREAKAKADKQKADTFKFNTFYTAQQKKIALEGNNKRAQARANGESGTSIAKTVLNDAQALETLARQNYEKDPTNVDAYNTWKQAQTDFFNAQADVAESVKADAAALGTLRASEFNLRADSRGAAAASVQAAVDVRNAGNQDPTSAEYRQNQAAVNDALSAERQNNMQLALKPYDLMAARGGQGAINQANIALGKARRQGQLSTGDELVDAEIAIAQAERAVRQAQDARVQSILRTYQVGVKDSLRSAGIGITAAQLNVGNAAREFGTDSGEYYDALAALGEAEKAQRSAYSSRVKALTELSKSSRGNDALYDTVQDVNAAKTILADAKKGGDIDEIIDAQTQVNNAEKAQRAALRARVETMYNLWAKRNGSDLDPVKDAQRQVSVLQGLLANAKQAGDLDQQMEYESRLIDAQRASSNAMQDVRLSSMQLRQAELQAMEDDVGAAQVARQQAQAQLDYGISQGVGEAEINRLRSQAITADKAAQDAVYTDRRNEYQYMLDMGEISKKTYMDHIKNLQSTVIPGSKKFKEIELELKRLKDDMSSDLSVNMPSTLGLPTVYEIRRMNQQTSYNSVGGAVGYNDNRSLNINGTMINNGMDFQQFVDVLAQFMGVPGTNGSYISRAQ